MMKCKEYVMVALLLLIGGAGYGRQEGQYTGPIPMALSSFPQGTTAMDTVPVEVPLMTLPPETTTGTYDNPDWEYQEDGVEPPYGAISQSFIGINMEEAGYFPPDPQIAASGDYVVEVVNSRITVYRKSDGSVVSTSSLYEFFSGLNPSSDFIFDPKITFDPQGNRWIVVALMLNFDTHESYYYLAISVTSNPVGDWYLYALDATLDGNNQSNNWADYPGLGFNDWGIFITSNQFSWYGGFSYAKLRILDKDAAYNGTLSGWYDFWDEPYSSCWKPVQSKTPSTTAYILRSY